MLIEELLAEYNRLPEYVGMHLVNVNQVGLFGDMPINVAATRGSVVEMEVLLNSGADLNSNGEHGYTPLHNAVEQGMVLAVKWLLEKGADKAALNHAGETPKDLALILGEVELVQLLS